MLDIHTHILPGIDDGAASMDEALAMARMAVADGTTAMIATPHTCDGVYDTTKSDVLEGCRKLNFHIRRENIPLVIFPGQEVRLTPELLENINGKKVLTLNFSKYILVELSMNVIPNFLPDLISSICARALIPVIAHPERNPVLMADMDLVKNLHYQGAVFQLTAGSFTGMFGRGIKKSAKRLTHMGMVHFMGSDTHSVKQRSPLMSKGIGQMEKFMDNPPFEPYDTPEPLPKLM